MKNVKRKGLLTVLLAVIMVFTMMPQSKSLPVKTHRAVGYESSNTKIAKVTSKGVVKGVKKGSCYIYAYAQNGLFVRIKVTVN